MGPPAVIPPKKKTRTTTQLGATDFHCALQIYAEGSFQNNWIFNFSHRWITKPHVKIPPLSHDGGSAACFSKKQREREKNFMVEMIRRKAEISHCTFIWACVLRNPPLTSVCSFNVEHWTQTVIRPCPSWHSLRTVILPVTLGIDFWCWPALNIDLKQYTRHYSVDKSVSLNNSSERRWRNFKELLLVPEADVLNCWPSGHQSFWWNCSCCSGGSERH